MGNQVGNKLIFKNTLLLYGRMMFAMVIALFTSRVVLNALGVDDYGIYGVVGGVVSMLGFINASLSSATSRFITFEMGRGEQGRLNLTFCCAFWVHLLIAIVVVVISETVGLWFLLNKMVIPDGRMDAALWVFHLSVFSAAIGITQVPYSASIISHERMDIYAYAELANIFLRLLVVYLLVIGDYDKLILYSVLNTIVVVGMMLYYRYFCLSHFGECHLHFLYEKKIVRRMFVFSGWDLFGNISVTARTQGISMLINMFFGVAVNAASSIAVSVQGLVMGFASNILMAVKPQIIKSYAAGEYVRTNELLEYSSLIIFYLMNLFSIPLIVEMHYVLQLWLGIVPNFSVCFCVFMLIFGLFSALAMLMLTIPHAAEKNKWPSIVNGVMYIMSLPASYVVFRIYHVVWFSYFYNVVTMMCGFLFISYLASRYLEGFSFKRYFFCFFVKNVAVVTVIMFAVLYLRDIMQPSFYRLLAVCMLSATLTLLAGIYVGLNSVQRSYALAEIRNKIKAIVS